MTSSLPLTSAMIPMPAHSRNRLTLRHVNDACRYSDHFTYSSRVISFVIWSASRSRLSKASFAFSSSESFPSPSGTFWLTSEVMSHGKRTLVLLIASTVATICPPISPFVGSSGAISPSPSHPSSSRFCERPSKRESFEYERLRQDHGGFGRTSRCW